MRRIAAYALRAGGQRIGQSRVHSGNSIIIALSNGIQNLVFKAEQSGRIQEERKMIFRNIKRSVSFGYCRECAPPALITGLAVCQGDSETIFSFETPLSYTIQSCDELFRKEENSKDKSVWYGRAAAICTLCRPNSHEIYAVPLIASKGMRPNRAARRKA